MIGGSNNWWPRLSFGYDYGVVTRTQDGPGFLGVALVAALPDAYQVLATTLADPTTDSWFVGPTPIGSWYVREITPPAVATYQGRLAESGSPVSGTADFRLDLLDRLGRALGSPSEQLGVEVAGGVFTLDLPFPEADLGAPDVRLAIEVAFPAGSEYVALPSQPIAPAPRALAAATAETADVAATAETADLAALATAALEVVDSTDQVLELSAGIAPYESGYRTPK